MFPAAAALRHRGAAARRGADPAAGRGQPGAGAHPGVPLGRRPRPLPPQEPPQPRPGGGGGSSSGTAGRYGTPVAEIQGASVGAGSGCCGGGGALGKGQGGGMYVDLEGDDRERKRERVCLRANCLSLSHLPASFSFTLSVYIDFDIFPVWHAPYLRSACCSGWAYLSLALGRPLARCYYPLCGLSINLLRPLFLRPLFLRPLFLRPLFLRPLFLRPLFLRPLFLRPFLPPTS
jgi:hypothetical protein